MNGGSSISDSWEVLDTLPFNFKTSIIELITLNVNQYHKIDEHNKENKTNFIKEQNQDLLEYHDAFSKNGVIFTSHMRVEQLLSTSLNDLRESIQSAYYEWPKASYVESIVDEQQKN